MHNILEMPLSKWMWINVLPLYAMQNTNFPQLIYNWLLYIVPQGNGKKKSLFLCSLLFCFCSLIKLSIKGINYLCIIKGKLF